jgi:hypothetical protein
MDVANSKFVNLLKDDAKLIVKCADEYNTKESFVHIIILGLVGYQILR